MNTRETLSREGIGLEGSYTRLPRPAEWGGGRCVSGRGTGGGSFLRTHLLLKRWILPPLLSYLTLDKLPNLAVPHSLYLSNGASNAGPKSTKSENPKTFLVQLEAKPDPNRCKVIYSLCLHHWT